MILRLCSADVAQEDVTIQQWLVEDRKLVQHLAELFNPATQTDPEALYNASILLSDLVLYSRRDAKDMEQYATMSPFLNILTRSVFLNYD